MKNFYVQTNIGKSKYVVNYHNGEKKHPDGSEFFDIAIFRNKKTLVEFTNSLQSDGYIELR